MAVKAQFDLSQLIKQRTNFLRIYFQYYIYKLLLFKSQIFFIEVMKAQYHLVMVQINSVHTQSRHFSTVHMIMHLWIALSRGLNCG
jgi:hypothetical protein